MGFQEAVVATEGLTNAYQRGLQALRRADRDRIRSSRPRNLTGSVNLDEALSETRPNDPRWDYGIGVRKARHSEVVVWIEVHPASSHHIQDVLDKLAWLKQWFVASAPRLNRMPKKYVWVASGSVHLPRHQRRRLAAQGIHFAGRQYKV